MNWSGTAVLVKMETKPDADGYRTETEISRREVFVDDLSATRSEFYAAQQVGTDIVRTFKLRAVDYESERIVEYKEDGADEATVYEVKRDYTKGEFYYLNCSLKSSPGSVGRKRAT